MKLYELIELFTGARINCYTYDGELMCSVEDGDSYPEILDECDASCAPCDEYSINAYFDEIEKFILVDESDAFSTPRDLGICDDVAEAMRELDYSDYEINNAFDETMEELQERIAVIFE